MVQPRLLPSASYVPSPRIVTVLLTSIVTAGVVLFFFVFLISPHQQEKLGGSCLTCVEHEGKQFAAVPYLYVGPRHTSTKSGIPPMSEESLESNLFWNYGGTVSADIGIGEANMWGPPSSRDSHDQQHGDGDVEAGGVGYRRRRLFEPAERKGDVIHDEPVIAWLAGRIENLEDQVAQLELIVLEQDHQSLED